MRDAGDEPFAYRFDRTARASELQTKYAELKDGEEVGDTHAVCGRVKACRKFGKLAFLQIEDDGGAVQLFVDDGAWTPGRAATARSRRSSTWWTWETSWARSARRSARRKASSRS